MKRLSLVSAVSVGALGAALVVSGTAGAASGSASAGGRTGVDRNAAVTHAKANVAAHAAAFGYGTGQGLTAKDVLVDANGTQHVRLVRTYRGLPVLGGDVVVHQSKAGAFRSGSGGLSRALTLSTRPAVSPRAAASIATAQFRGKASTSAPRLVVDAAGTAPALAWETVVSGVTRDQTPSELHVVVNAATGKVVAKWDGVKTGTGNGYYVGTVPLTTTLSGGTYQLVDPSRGGQYTVDMRNRNGGKGVLFTDADDVWGDGTLANRQTVAVDAQFGAAMTWDFYKTTYGRNGIKNDGVGAKSRVHYGDRYQNAFWSDSCFCMTYGDGANNADPFTAIDVAGHEMTHGVTSATADLRYSSESGGLNEATSDVFGTMVEFYANNAEDTPDYLIGEELNLFGTGRPLRWMDQPSKDGRSVDCWAAGIGKLNVHYSSGVGNHFFYLLSEGSGAKTINGVAYNSPTCDGSTVTGIGRDAAAKIWYRALTVYMTPSTDYHEARAAMLSAAADLYGSGSTQHNAVAAAWKAVNVS